jgi:NADH:ubiquinone oxidoreductase subunit 3 (subunit A)
MNSCTTTKNCSGATFNDIENTCKLISGNGNIVNSVNNTAIIKQALQYSYELKSINNELMKTNNAIILYNNDNANKYNENKEKSSQKSEILQNNYNTLEQERIQIDKLVGEYETLNSAQENGTINVNSNYYRYLLYFLLAIFLVFILFKINKSTNQRGGGAISKSYQIMILLSIIIIFNAIIKNNY